MTNKNKKLLVAFISILAVCFFTFLLIFNPLPIKATNTCDTVDRYVINTHNNSFPKQGKNQCSAFSSAFILRHLGHSVDGATIYENISGKISLPPWRGYVFYTGIIKMFKYYGYNMKIYVGNLASLRTTLTNEIPIIVQIGNGLKWQHYMVLIGYDKQPKELYFYDPNKHNDTNNEQPGNRTLNEEKFLELWNNKTFLFNRSYFVVEK